MAFMSVRRWLVLCMFLLPSFSWAIEKSDLPRELQTAGIEEKLGTSIDIENIRLRNEESKEVALSEYFKRGKPVLLTMIYYECPNLCNFLLNGLTASLRSLSWGIGKEFDIVSVSINPRETSDLAKKKKEAYLKEYGRLGSETGWHFLTGEDEQIKKLASQIGFNYYYDEKEKQYAHSAGVFVLTPQGKISRILYGIDFANKDLRLSLLEASNGEIGTIIERVLMFCYRYDPDARSYSIYAMRLVQAGGIFTLIAMFAYFGFFWWTERKRILSEAKNNQSHHGGSS